MVNTDEITTKRIEALTDGIYAIAMTLLVLSLNFPEAVKAISQLQLHQLLYGQIDKFFNYALSFILLAAFWISHHQQFNHIKKTNKTHLWINIFSLLFIALIPFSTSLMGDYPSDVVSEAFFALNLLIIGVLYSINWIYATKNHRLVDKDLSKEHINMATRMILIPTAVYLLALIIAFINPVISSYIYISIPVLIIFGKRR